MTTFTIRPATEEDVEAYRDLRLQALEECPTAFGADYETDRHRSLDEWRNRLRQNPTPPSVVFLASEGDRLVGMTGAHSNSSSKMRHSAHIWGVYVRPEARGNGLATRLLDACCNWAKERGITILKLAVVTTNIAAIQTYNRAGFQIYGIEPAALCYASVCYEEFLMAKRL